MLANKAFRETEFADDLTLCVIFLPVFRVLFPHSSVPFGAFSFDSNDTIKTPELIPAFSVIYCHEWFYFVLAFLSRSKYDQRG